MRCNGSTLTRCCPLQWENTNNKTSVVLYAVGAVVALWLTTTVVGAVNNVPLVRTHHCRDQRQGPSTGSLAACAAAIRSAVRCAPASRQSIACANCWHWAGAACLKRRTNVHWKVYIEDMEYSAVTMNLLLQLPKLLELVGLGYSAWFTYRYLLFKVRPCARRPTCPAPVTFQASAIRSAPYNLCRVQLAVCAACCAAAD